MSDETMTGQSEKYLDGFAEGLEIGMHKGGIIAYQSIISAGKDIAENYRKENYIKQAETLETFIQSLERFSSLINKCENNKKTEPEEKC